MAELEHRLRGKGCLKAHLLVARDNQRALRCSREIGRDDMDLHLLGKDIA